jgi:AcrR family transcriptional regulator
MIDVMCVPICPRYYYSVITTKSLVNMTTATPSPEYVEQMPELDDVGTTLLAAAANLLATAGPEALTVRRIAADAGMSTMNVYSRFGNKEGVVERLFVNGFELLATGMRAAPTTDDPLADLRSCRTAYRAFATANPTLYSVMFEKAVPDFEPSAAAMEIGTRTLEVLAGRVERAMDAGLLRRADPFTTAAIIWSTCHGVVSLELKGIDPHKINFDDVYAGACEAVLIGLAARAAVSTDAGPGNAASGAPVSGDAGPGNAGSGAALSGDAVTDLQARSRQIGDSVRQGDGGRG